MTGLLPAGLPHSEILGSKVICTYPSLSQLITSFIASESQGIHRLPLLTFCITDTGSFFIAKIENRVGLIYLQLALFFSLLYFFEVVQYVKDLFITPTGYIVENNGFEPLTLCVQSRCSSQLS